MDSVNRLESRAWSCSELMRGSAAVADQSPAGAAIKQELDLLAVTAEATPEELEAMLKARVLFQVFVSKPFLQEVDSAIEAHGKPEEEDAMVRARVSIKKIDMYFSRNAGL